MDGGKTCEMNIFTFASFIQFIRNLILNYTSHRVDPFPHICSSLWGEELAIEVGSCLLRFGVYVDEYEGPRERARRVTRPGEMKQKCN